MADHLSIKDLPDASKIVDSTAYLVPGSWLRAMLAVQQQIWRGENVSAGPNIRIRQSGEAGYSITGADQSSTGGGGSSPGPFSITIRANPADKTGNTFQAMVNTNSDILLSTKPNNSLSCTGLGVWFNCIANDVFTVYMPVSSYVPSSATIQSYGQGNTTFDPTSDPWNTGDNGIVFDNGATPPQQAGLNIMIGYTTPDAKGKPYLVQCQQDHILIESGVIAGRAAVYDFSHRRRYGITAI